MELTLTTPALLFPAISLLLLAYTSRFLAIASLIRDLHSRYSADDNQRIHGQLQNLQYRIIIIRNMQIFGAASFFLCVLCMFLIFAGFDMSAKWVFGSSLVLLLVSLALSLREIQVSIDALSLQLKDFEKKTS
jgi:hypothetical protein